MFFIFSQPQHVLNMFLNFWRFSASCSYKKGSYKKRVYSANCNNQRLIFDSGSYLTYKIYRGREVKQIRSKQVRKRHSVIAATQELLVNLFNTICAWQKENTPNPTGIHYCFVHWACELLSRSIVSTSAKYVAFLR